MSALTSFAIARHWPAKHPDRIQLYSVPTPNGVKVSIALDELGLPYEPHLTPMGGGGTKTSAFQAPNPNSKIAAIIDPMAPAARPSDCPNRARSCCISPRRPGS